MPPHEWKASFLSWYELTNREFVDSKDSMGMLSELQARFRQVTAQEKRWMLDILREWLDSEDEFRRYDSRSLVPKFEYELGDTGRGA